MTNEKIIKKKVVKKAKKVKEKKIKPKSKLLIKQEIIALEEKINNVAVDLINMNLVRGSDKHMTLRAELHELRAQLEELGAREVKSMSPEEMKNAATKGEAKKKEIKKKKDNMKTNHKF